MTNKPPRIELTFGKNDEDIYNWIKSQGISNATFVKRLLRERMNEENGLIVARPVVESKPVATKLITVVNEPENEPEPEEEQSSGYMAAMNNSGGRDF